MSKFLFYLLILYITFKLFRFKSIGAQKFKYPSQAVFTLDHDVQNKSEKVSGHINTFPIY